MKRLFEVVVTTTLIVEIDEKVIKRGLSKSFAKDFYAWTSADEVAAHVGRNIGIKGCYLRTLDGFADLKDEMVTICDEDSASEATEIEPVRVRM